MFIIFLSALNETNVMCVCKAVVNGIRKKDCVPHPISGTLSVEDSRNLLFVSSTFYIFTTFRTFPIKCLMDFCEHTYKTKGNKHWTRWPLVIISNCIIAVMWMRYLPNQKQNFWAPQEKFMEHCHIYFKNEMNGYRAFPARAPTAWAKHCLCVQLHDVRCLLGNQ